MATFAAQTAVETRSEILHFSFDEPRSLGVDRLQQNMDDIQALLALALRLSPQAGRVPNWHQENPKVTRRVKTASPFRVRSLRYGSPFEMEIEFLVASGPSVLAGAGALVALFTSVAAGRLMWKKGNSTQADSNKKNAEANLINAQAEELRRKQDGLLLDAVKTLAPGPQQAAREWIASANASKSKNHVDLTPKTFGRSYGVPKSKPEKLNSAPDQMRSFFRLAGKRNASLKLEDD